MPQVEQQRRNLNIHSPLMIAVAPNGARKSRQDHGELPITAAQLAHTAAACAEAGACMLHLHVRDANGGHSLDATHYKEAIAAVRREAGPELIIQITTEAVGKYLPAAQMQVVREVRPEAVSLAIRELCPAAADESAAGEFFHWLQQESICPQYILYSLEDILRCNDLQARGVIPQQNASVLLVLGRYTSQQQSDPADLQPLLEALNPQNNWWLCAFGATEAACMSNAISLGGHCRVGFENNLLLPDGSTAPDNAALVQEVVRAARGLGRPLATGLEARQLLGIGQTMIGLNEHA